MKTKIKITNQDLYYQQIVDVDTSGLSCSEIYNGIYGNFCANGHLSIELENGEWIESTGDHGSKDYERDFGFILVPDIDESL